MNTSMYIFIPVYLILVYRSDTMTMTGEISVLALAHAGLY